MLRSLALVVILATVGLTAVLVHNGDISSPTPPVAVEPTAASLAIGPPLYPPVFAPSASPSAPAASLVIPDCRLTVIEKQEVPSQRDGVLLFVGSEIEPDETVPPHRLITVTIGGHEQRFRRLKEGDVVRPGQLLAYLDDRLSRDERAIKKAKVASSQADLEAAIKTSDEARNRYETQLRLRQEGRGATSEEEVRGARLAADKAVCDMLSKREAVTLAERELSQAETILRMHQLRSTMPGILQTIYKRPGEAVKALEPVAAVHHLARLRAEGLIDVQHCSRLRPGMPVQVVPAPPESPRQTLLGHMREITAVAVGSKVLSAGNDGTVRVWNQAGEERILHHPAPVLAVAGTPPGAKTSLCLSGAADGVARLWALTAREDRPWRELTGHQGAVTSVAFSPNGRFCATGGEDRTICLWDTVSGALRYRLPEGHRGAVTYLQFTPQCRLVSAGRDNTIQLWELGTTAACRKNIREHRSGEIVCPGVSADGNRMIYDQGNTLRLLSLPEGRNQGIVAGSSPAPFTTFALFSPDARWLLTAGPAEGQVRLWRAPTPTAPAAPVRQLVMPEPAIPTCAAFAPDGSFLVVGSRDRSVRIWPMPQVEAARTGEITFVDRAVESSNHQVRTWAEVPNPDGRLLPGTMVWIVVGDRKN